VPHTHTHSRPPHTHTLDVIVPFAHRADLTRDRGKAAGTAVEIADHVIPLFVIERPVAALLLVVVITLTNGAWKHSYGVIVAAARVFLAIAESRGQLVDLLVDFPVVGAVLQSGLVFFEARSTDAKATAPVASGDHGREEPLALLRKDVRLCVVISRLNVGGVGARLALLALDENGLRFDIGVVANSLGVGSRINGGRQHGSHAAWL
jgi:hypothetical protein